MNKPCRTRWQRAWLKLDVTDDAIQAMADQAEAFAGRWFRNNPKPSMLVLAGPYGTGKSHVAKALHTFATQAGWSSCHDSKNWGSRIPTSLYLRWPEIADAFKKGEYGVLEDCFTESLVILDDVGAEHDPSKNAADKLCQILTRRARLFTVITTNITPGLWPERFDGRIADRLLRNSIVVNLEATDSYTLR